MIEKEEHSKIDNSVDNKRIVYELFKKHVDSCMKTAKTVALGYLGHPFYVWQFLKEYSNIEKVYIIEPVSLKFLYDRVKHEKIETIYVGNTANSFEACSMKFDCIIMNPPYNHSLHTDIFAVAQKYVSNNGMCVSLNPLNPYIIACKNNAASFKSKAKYHIKVDKIDMISNPEANKLFNIGLSDNLGILVFDKSSEIEKQPSDFNFIVPFYDFFIHMKSKNIIAFKSKFEKTPKAFSLRYGIGCGTNSGTKLGFGCTSFANAINKAPAGHLAFINLNTQQEQYNCWKSGWTDFIRVCSYVDDSIIPYMGSCIHPRTGNLGYIDEWTTNDFCAYFDISIDMKNKIISFMRDNGYHRECINNVFTLTN